MILTYYCKQLKKVADGELEPNPQGTGSNLSGASNIPSTSTIAIKRRRQSGSIFVTQESNTTTIEPETKITKIVRD